MGTYIHNDAGYSMHSLTKPDQSNQVLDVVAQINQCIIIKCTLEGRIKFITGNVSAFLGFSPAEMVGKTLNDFIFEVDDQIVKEYNQLDSLTKHLLRMRKKDGTYIWMELITSQIADPITKNPLEIIGALKNISVETSESLQQNDKLSAVGQLAAGIAHEIRNPLTSLKGFIQLMKSDHQYNEQYLKIMEMEIERIDSISKELMLLAKPNKNDFKLCNLVTILKKCMALLEGEMFQKRIRILQTITAKPVLVVCDEQKIKQVIINLIKNAIEAMDQHGEIVIEIDKKHDQAVLSITDQGCGIPEELIGKIGQPFFTTKKNGNGLGLMMCYKIIAEHQGEIHVKSKVGVGTTFVVTLPLADNRKDHPSS